MPDDPWNQSLIVFLGVLLVENAVLPMPQPRATETLLAVEAVVAIEQIAAWPAVA